MNTRLKNVETLRERERERESYNLRDGEKGITLIALIVTIIVLLILAMVSVNLILRENLINKAQIAADEYEKAAQNEAEGLNEFERVVLGIGNSNPEDDEGETPGGGNEPEGGDEPETIEHLLLFGENYYSRNSDDSYQYFLTFTLNEDGTLEITERGKTNFSKYYTIDYDYENQNIKLSISGNLIMTLYISRCGENNEYGVIYQESSDGSTDVYMTNQMSLRTIVGKFVNQDTGNYFIFNNEKNAIGEFEYWEDGELVTGLGHDANYALYNNIIYYDFSGIPNTTMEYDGNKIIYDGEEYIRE